MALTIRSLDVSDTAPALALYNELTLGPETSDAGAFEQVLAHPGTTVYGAEVDSGIQAMVTLHLLPNVTWNARPYGLVENVVTSKRYRGQGLGRAVLEAAIDAAWRAGAYKIMLLTGQKRGAKGFYESVGFSGEDKHAMVIRRT